MDGALLGAGVAEIGEVAAVVGGAEAADAVSARVGDLQRVTDRGDPAAALLARRGAGGLGGGSVAVDVEGGERVGTGSGQVDALASVGGEAEGDGAGQVGDMLAQSGGIDGLRTWGSAHADSNPKARAAVPTAFLRRKAESEAACAPCTSDTPGG